MGLNANNEEALIDESYYMEGNHAAGAEMVLRKNNKLFNEMKSGTWSQVLTTQDKNMTYTIGALDGERYMKFEQHNVDAIKEECKQLREFYRIHGTDNPFFPGTAHMMKLPKAIAHEIQGKWFGNRPWELIKRDKEDKIKFYAIINEYYSDFVCHPSGKIPLPYNPAVPTR